MADCRQDGGTIDFYELFRLTNVVDLDQKARADLDLALLSSSSCKVHHLRPFDGMSYAVRDIAGLCQ